MEINDIKLTDVKRILIGEAPLLFMVEVFIRTVIMYLLLIIMVRLLGKRMSGQLSITELSVMVLMGAIISAPMELPERGIVQGLVILVLLLLCHQGLTWLEVKSKKVELITQGKPKLLIKDGVIQLQTLYQTGISKDQLFAMLRGKNVFTLGGIKRLYLETCGLFTLYPQEKPAPGLSVMPPDEDIKIMQQQAGEWLACCTCGFTKSINNSTDECPACSQREWQPAVD